MDPTIEQLVIGTNTSLVAANLTVDLTDQTATGTLSTLVAGVQVPVAALTVSTTDGVTTVSGTTAAGTNVSVAFPETTPTTATATVAPAGALPVTTDEAVTVLCFASGTGIRTPRGDVAVETLQVGDVVVAASGAEHPVRWLGHRTIDCRQHPHPRNVWPVRIAAHAFGHNRPARDLVVSPGHALCVDVLGEVLIPATALVNGATITQEEVANVTYWHVELGTHEIILAENMPAESYMEMGNRSFFAEAGVVDLNAKPDAAPATHDDFCRPFHAAGPIVEAIRRQLAVRAQAKGWRLAEPERLGDLHLLVDGRRIDPIRQGTSARFNVPAEAREVLLASETYVPAQVGHGDDRRALGVYVSRIVVDDGFAAPVVVDADDGRLGDGFEPAEAGPARWTNGRARLPAELWSEVKGDFFLRVDLAGMPQRKWERSLSTIAATSPRIAA